MEISTTSRWHDINLSVRCEHVLKKARRENSYIQIPVIVSHQLPAGGDVGSPGVVLPQLVAHRGIEKAVVGRKGQAGGRGKIYRILRYVHEPVVGQQTTATVEIVEVDAVEGADPGIPGTIGGEDRLTYWFSCPYLSYGDGMC